MAGAWNGNCLAREIAAILPPAFAHVALSYVATFGGISEISDFLNSLPLSTRISRSGLGRDVNKTLDEVQNTCDRVVHYRLTLLFGGPAVEDLIDDTHVSEWKYFTRDDIVAIAEIVGEVARNRKMSANCEKAVIEALKGANEDKIEARWKVVKSAKFLEAKMSAGCSKELVTGLRKTVKIMCRFEEGSQARAIEMYQKRGVAVLPRDLAEVETAVSLLEKDKANRNGTGAQVVGWVAVRLITVLAVRFQQWKGNRRRLADKADAKRGIEALIEMCYRVPQHLTEEMKDTIAAFREKKALMI
jgi:hypothetical protein